MRKKKFDIAMENIDCMMNMLNEHLAKNSTPMDKALDGYALTVLSMVKDGIMKDMATR